MTESLLASDAQPASDSAKAAALADVPLPTPFDDYYLSTLSPADFPRLLDLYNNTDLAQILFSPPFPYTLEDANWFYENKTRLTYPGYPGAREFWAIRSKSNNSVLVGACGVHPTPEDTVFRLGYYLAPEFRRKGIMPVVLNNVLKKFPGATVFAEAEVDNAGSQKVLKISGFQQVEGYVGELQWPESKGGGVRKLLKFVKEC
ncbi:hypothetical protein TWF694_003227 [Orbilia ellipsospora]|uniref:N-acetyltransferase domain-containing protein n=1 Tax=Orbilia ellipsospora TaxID=2528407 RepID=A0AAV9X0V5_9PEZI